MFITWRKDRKEPSTGQKSGFDWRSGVSTHRIVAKKWSRLAQRSFDPPRCGEKVVSTAPNWPNNGFDWPKRAPKVGSTGQKVAEIVPNGPIDQTVVFYWWSGTLTGRNWRKSGFDCAVGSSPPAQVAKKWSSIGFQKFMHQTRKCLQRKGFVHHECPTGGNSVIIDLGTARVTGNVPRNPWRPIPKPNTSSFQHP